MYTNNYRNRNIANNFKHNNNVICTAVEKPKILLVEDNRIIGKINSIFLKEMGCDVTLARNAGDAIELLVNRYDLFLLDIGLPDINGIEVCKIIRRLPKFSHTPVIFLTAFGEGLNDECIAAGGDDFAVKPLMRETLQELISKWLSTENNHMEKKHEYQPR